jgi:hypothetical protein
LGEHLLLLAKLAILLIRDKRVRYLFEHALNGLLVQEHRFLPVRSVELELRAEGSAFEEWLTDAERCIPGLRRLLERCYPLALKRYVFLDNRRYFDGGHGRRRRGSYSAFASGAQGRCERKHDEATVRIRTAAFPSDVQVLNNVLVVGTPGSELRPAASEHAQKPLTTLVDERHFVEVNDAGASRIRAVVLLPVCPELPYPRVGESAMQNPCLFRGCFTEIDLQHAIFVSVSQ